MPERTTLLCVATLTLIAADQQQPPRYVERVEVTRLLIDARVVNDAGQPVVGLGVVDFKVKMDGKVARVESVEWVGGVSPEDAPLPATSVEGPLVLPKGRLIVFLFQKSLERGRIVGFMRMLIEAQPFLDTFTPEDRIAVLSFDSHLKIWLDFTNDLDLIRAVFKRGILFEKPGPIQESDPPSLVATLAPHEARRIYSIEEALLATAEALTPLPGAKSLVLVGHGFGRLGLGGVQMENKYERASKALQESRTSVFCLDVTDADYHSLEAGLKIVAEDTGGFFERTHIFSQRALDRLAGALAGHYVLFVEPPEDARRPQRIEVDVIGKKGRVLTNHSSSTR